jgi:hypothetical protein
MFLEEYNSPEKTSYLELFLVGNILIINSFFLYIIGLLMLCTSGCISKGVKISIQRDICSFIFPTTLFTIIKKWRLPFLGPSIISWMDLEHYNKGNKSDTEEQILHDTNYMINVK